MLFALYCMPDSKYGYTSDELFGNSLLSLCNTTHFHGSAFSHSVFDTLNFKEVVEMVRDKDGGARRMPIQVKAEIAQGYGQSCYQKMTKRAELVSA